MLQFIILFFITFLIFLVLDMIGINKVILPIFEKEIGHLMRDKPLLGWAAAFYVLYVLGVMYLVSYPYILGDLSLSQAIINSAVIGLLAYGTYEFTSFSIMKDWTLKQLIIDSLWGGILTSSSTTLGLLIFDRFFNK